MSTKGHRCSIRLQHYDYAQNGAYFITICSHQRECIFGEIINDAIQLSDVGIVIEEEWLRTEQIRIEVILDEYVIMPNHFHAIIVLDRRSPSLPKAAPLGTKPKSIPAIIQGFKAVVTSRVNKLRETSGITIWQRNYYEHIIRNEQSLNKIREYIRNNSAKWAEDRDNPQNILNQGR